MTETLIPTESLATETVIAGFDALGAGSHGWLLLDQPLVVEILRVSNPTDSSREAVGRPAKARWAAMVDRALARAEDAPQYDDDPADVEERQSLADGLVRNQASAVRD